MDILNKLLHTQFYNNRVSISGLYIKVNLTSMKLSEDIEKQTDLNKKLQGKRWLSLRPGQRQ